MIGALALPLFALLAASSAFAQVDPPSLVADVAAGRLPPLAERLPANPAAFVADRADMVAGRYGGEIRTLVSRSQDTRMMVVFGYSRLVRYDAAYNIVPDILESVETEGDRVFTFKLRKGHRWSDGAPFTAADFRYYWDDVANNRRTSPAGPPKTLMVDGKPPKVEYPDEHTIRYSWAGPNPHFLPALANASPLYVFRPAHYLKQFHEKYAGKAALEEAVKKSGTRNWAQLHNRMDNMYRNDNPELPSLEPWVLKTKPPAERFVFERNPYFHRVDAAGRQLPYIDRAIMVVVDTKLIPIKAGTGEADLQARGVSFNNYTFLRQGAKQHAFDAHLWDTAKGAHLALYPNLNVNDEGWRALFRDVRFRRALSLAVNRREINQVVYFGLAKESANTVLAASPLFRQEYRDAYAKFDLPAANRLLDAIGLTKRDSRGVRLLPDGRPIEIVVESAGEETEQTDVLELVHDSWLQAGIKLYSRPSQREVFRNRVFAGETKMSVWAGLENGVPTAAMSPEELAPTTQQQLQWPKWGQYVETGGQSGEAAALPEAVELARLNDEWRKASDAATRERIWHRMLTINAEQVYAIGLVAQVKQPVVVSKRLKNVPVKGVYNWDPGAFFGIYRPDLFWIADPAQTAAAN